MELQGSLGRLQIGDIVQILEIKRATGVLRLSDGLGSTGRIFFREGSIVHVEGPRGSNSPIVLSDLFEWESEPGAEFAFDSQPVEVPDGFRTNSNIGLMLDAAVAKDVFCQLKERYGSTHVVPTISQEPPRKEVQLATEDWMLLRSLSPGRMLEEVFAETHLEPTAFKDSLLKLEEAGVLTLTLAAAPGAQPEPELSLETLSEGLEHALGVFAAALGPLVVANFARQALAAAEQRNLALTALSVTADENACRFEIDDPASLASALRKDQAGTLRSLGEVVAEIRKKCSHIVRSFARASPAELLGSAATALAAMRLEVEA